MSMDRIKLEAVADMGKQAFYRDYKRPTDFFDTPHFLFLSCTTYATMMNDKFQDEKTRNKSQDGFSYVSLSGPWLLREDCEVKTEDDSDKKFIETKLPVFCFEFDAMVSSVHSLILKKKGKCGDLMRISNKDIWKLCIAPNTCDIFYYQLGEKIYLENLKCDPGKITVNYIPAIMPQNTDCTIPETMVDGIITTVLQIMFGAKNETPFVKTANNSNPNADPANEVARETGKA